MNVIQANIKAQSTPPSDPSQSVKSPTTEDFEKQLFVAQKDTEWFTKTDAQSEKERVHKEQSEKKRLDEVQENERSAELVTVAVLAKTQLNDSTETMRVVDDIEHEALQQKSMSKQDTFNKAVQEKVAVQKAHLVTPTVPGEDAAEDPAVRFSELLTRGLEEKQNQLATELKNAGLKPEIPSSRNNSARLGALPQMSEMLQRNNVPGGIQNVINAQDLQIDRQTVKAVTKEQSLNLDQKNQTEKGLANKSGVKTAPSKGTSASSTLTATVEVNNTDTASQSKSLESKAPTQVNVSDVVGKVKLMISTKTNEMVMRLAPEHLGKLEIRLKKDGEKFIGRFKVENSEAKKALESQISQLQQRLEEQGIHIEEFSILINEQGSDDSTFTFKDGQNQRQDSPESNLKSSDKTESGHSNTASSVSTAGGSDSGVSLYI